MGSIIGNIKKSVFGLQFRTTLLLTGVVLAATGLTGVMYLRLSSRLAAAEATRSARELAKALAVAAAANVEQDNRKELLKIAQTMVPEGELVYILFADMSGKLLAVYQSMYSCRRSKCSRSSRRSNARNRSEKERKLSTTLNDVGK